ncbi:hypothetical protein AB0D49_02460 [Streptomyces sp. NPDC048290]|uniref:hypothetical protein n=1 Tax=Streptomyces sp. NPDC048290 TaxID=3155811 RepID=UPI00341513DF
MRPKHPTHPTHPTTPVTQAALWLHTLARQFPELTQELAPSAGAARHRACASTPGHGPGAAPVRLHVSDALRDITDGVIELEEAVRDRLGLPRPRRAPVPERLGRIAALLTDIGRDALLAAHVRDESRRMAHRCARVLGDTETVVRVSGRCPWCASVSLRAFPERGAVLCVNPGCRCTDPGCGCHDDPAHRHTWEETDQKPLPETDEEREARR